MFIMKWMKKWDCCYSHYDHKFVASHHYETCGGFGESWLRPVKEAY